MIDRQHSKLQFCCDTCGQVYEGASGNFETEWADAKAEGWRATKVGEAWEHSCPECKG